MIEECGIIIIRAIAISNENMGTVLIKLFMNENEQFSKLLYYDYYTGNQDNWYKIIYHNQLNKRPSI